MLTDATLPCQRRWTEIGIGFYDQFECMPPITYFIATDRLIVGM